MGMGRGSKETVFEPPEQITTRKFAAATRSSAPLSQAFA